MTKQFAIRSIPYLMMYNPEGEVLKRGRDAIGHILLPNVFPDAPDDAPGGSMNSWLIVLGVLAGFGLLLLIATKSVAPPKRVRRV